MLGMGSATLGWPGLTMANKPSQTGLASSAPAPLLSPILPPYLKPGATIGITSPAGFTPLEEIQPAVNTLKRWGFNVIVGSSIGQVWGTFGGTDAQRASDFQAMLDNDRIGAILCARGGYGMVRIIDRLSFDRFRRNPKWLIGFSDITVLHSHVNRQLGIATLHAKMCAGFSEDQSQIGAAALASMMTIHSALTGAAIDYPIAPNPHNRDGQGSGIVVGGNLRTLETLCGSASELDTDHKILLVEDTDEPLYSVDRMFWHLKRSGKLDRLAGLLIGGFNIPPDAGNALPFSPDFHEIVLEKVREYNYPVCFDFPVGHQELNLAIKLGMPHRLVLENGLPVLSELTEPI